MKMKTFLLMLVLTCTLISCVGCGRRMNSSTDGTNKNNTTTQDTTVKDNYDNTTTPNNDTYVDENYNNDMTNDNVVDGVVNSVDDTVNGITNGVEDVIDGVDHSVNDNVNTPSTGTNNTSR